MPDREADTLRERGIRGVDLIGLVEVRVDPQPHASGVLRVFESKPDAGRAILVRHRGFDVEEADLVGDGEDTGSEQAVEETNSEDDAEDLSSSDESSTSEESTSGDGTTAADETTAANDEPVADDEPTPDDESTPDDDAPSGDDQPASDSDAGGDGQVSMEDFL